MPTKFNNTMQRRDFCKGVAATTAILPTALVAEAIENSERRARRIRLSKADQNNIRINPKFRRAEWRCQAY